MKIYNTLTRKKEDLVPVSGEEFKIYVCGPTVYNYFHIGNARPFVVFDTLRRYLEYRGNKVEFVQNFTDVDDKIIAQAKEEDRSAAEISEKYIKAYFEDADLLNVSPATLHPKVTENINDIINLVKDLIDKDYAYEIDGDVYFSARKFKDYGKLSGQDVDELESGARVSADERKKDPLDFALWKKRKEDSEIAWDSPWGMGRPGWHIECSAMSKKYLGETIDIHAGGQDLMFPHHENEIAQSEAASGKPLANYWMHNGYITIDNEKMAKSKGNFFTVRDVLKDFDGEEIRFFLLSGHYRSPINFSRELMEQAKNGLERLRNAKQTLMHLIKNGTEEISEDEKKSLAGFGKYREKFNAAMDDDLNTSLAIAVIFDLISEVNTVIREKASKKYAEEALKILTELSLVLGLLIQGDNKSDESSDDDPDAEAKIKALIDAREKARAEKDWARADALREQLFAMGVVIKDTPQGVQIIRE